MNQEQPRPLFASYLSLDGRIWVLAVARMINTMGFSLVMPFMTMYLVESRHLAGKVYGAMYLAMGIVAAMSQAVSGELADRFGRRRVMVSALCLRALNMAALGMAVLHVAPVHVLGILLVINGFLRAQFEPAASAQVTDLSPAGSRVAAFGLQRIGINVGWAIGPALGGALAHYSYGGMFLVAAVVTFLAAAAVFRVKDVTSASRPGTEPITKGAWRRALAENPAFFLYLTLVLLGSIMTVQLYSTMSVYARTELQLSRAEIGSLYFVNGVLVVCFQAPAVALIQRFGARMSLLMGPALYTMAYVGMGFAESFRAMALSIAILTAGEVVFSPALSDMAAHLGDPQKMGRAFGLFGLMQQLGLSLGPYVGGVVYDRYRHEHVLMWSVIAAGMSIVGLGYAAFVRRFRAVVSQARI
ncbi:MAG: MFS transporter [Deltaproteobacteria bacterium]|nr:MFS transporter [Deltaproteobacteria bacterium]